MADQVSDATLLERFVNRREEAAFAALMRRHVPGVRSACRRILRSEHDAEDVVQATFLVLALKASEVPWRDSVGGWLYAVARRLSLDARAVAWRRCRREMILPGSDPFPEQYHPTADPQAEIDRHDLRRVIDDELRLLPEKYRAPVVLCDLEGMTHTEAARRLGWPAGSMSRRLTRARALLRQRLAGRALALGVVLACAVLAGVWAGGRDPRWGRKTADVRGAMAVFQKADGVGLDLDRFLTRISEGGASAQSADDVEQVARQALLVADRIDGFDPGRDRPAWDGYTEQLQLSALAMVQASRDDDELALLAAARRLNGSCVRCHLTFRQ
jgi:RNA polymerase sigma-70 factor (ECF subfamily)